MHRTWRCLSSNRSLFEEGDMFVDLHLHTHPTSDRIEMFMVPLSSVVSGSSFQMPSSGSKQADPNISIIIHDVVVVMHECFPKIVFRLRDRAFFWRGTVGKRLDFPLQSMVSRNHTLQLIWDKIPSFRNWFTIFPGWIAEGTGKTRFWAKVWFFRKMRIEKSWGITIILRQKAIILQKPTINLKLTVFRLNCPFAQELKNVSLEPGLAPLGLRALSRDVISQSIASFRPSINCCFS